MPKGSRSAFGGFGAANDYAMHDERYSANESMAFSAAPMMKMAVSRVVCLSNTFFSRVSFIINQPINQSNKIKNKIKKMKNKILKKKEKKKEKSIEMKNKMKWKIK